MTEPKEDGGFKIVHNIVYSVKGGCGKTSFSLFLTLSNMYFDGKAFFFGVNSDEELEPDSRRRVANYMLDLDFLGTILMDTVGVDMDSSLVTMSDIIFDGKKIYDMGESNRVGEGSEEKYIIYSSHHEIDKEKYHVKRENTPLLKYDDFRYEIENIQKDIELFSRLRNRHSKDNGMDVEQLNMIYDMPPNSDGYTDAFLNEMIEVSNRKPKGDEPEQEVVLYLLFNSASTLRCDIEWLERFLSARRLPNILYVFVHCVNNPECSGEEYESLIATLLSERSAKPSKYCYYKFEYCRDVSRFNDDTEKKPGVIYSLNTLFKEYKGSDFIIYDREALFKAWDDGL